jgi:Tfp pilus assembly protein PilZ
MEKENRHEKRVKKNLLVYSDNGDFDLLGVSANISKNGVFIESPNPIHINSEIEVVIAVDNELFKLKGEVEWLKGPEDKHPDHIPAGMGIRITEAPAEYLNYVEYLKHSNGNGIVQNSFL